MRDRRLGAPEGGTVASEHVVGLVLREIADQNATSVQVGADEHHVPSPRPDLRNRLDHLEHAADLHTASLVE